MLSGDPASVQSLFTTTTTTTITIAGPPAPTSPSIPKPTATYGRPSTRLTPVATHIKSSQPALTTSSPSTAKKQFPRRDFASCSSLFPTLRIATTAQRLFLFAAILYCLLGRHLTSAAPVTSDIYRKSNSNDRKIPSAEYREEEVYFGKNTPPYEEPLNDEPPRKELERSPLPKEWKLQPQERIWFLKNKYDQYLQIYDGKIMGTKESNPPLGIVRFQSHNNHLVISSYLEGRYLCMDHQSQLYLKGSPDSDCELEELADAHHHNTYRFVKYSNPQGNKTNFLAIDCDPIPGNRTDSKSKAARFMRVIVQLDPVEVKQNFIKSGPQQFLAAKCESLEKRRQMAKRRRQELKWRWCMNIDRMKKKEQLYMEKCRKGGREKNCSGKRRDGKRCVCEVLEKMLKYHKRAKRKCLVERLTDWVKNRNGTVNPKAVLELSKRLIPSYPGISRRWRQLHARSKKRREKERQSRLQLESQDHGKAQITHSSSFLSALSPSSSISSILPISSVGLTSVSPSSSAPSLSFSTQASKDSRHQYLKERHRRRRRRRGRPVIKLNKILARYGHELLASPSGVSSSSGVSSPSLSSSGVSSSKLSSPGNITSDTAHTPLDPRTHPIKNSSQPKKNEKHSLLSVDFRNAVNKLSSKHHRKRQRGHRRRRRKHRRRNPK